MIAGGSVATWIAASAMQNKWAYRLPETKICDLSILLSGVVLLAAGASWLLFNGYRRAACAFGAVAASVFAMTLFLGLISGAMPCSGPL